MSGYKVDTVVIGAGAVGLAIAESLSRSGREVIVLESEDDFGKVTSSRNSGVIHAANCAIRQGNLRPHLGILYF